MSPANAHILDIFTFRVAEHSLCPYNLLYNTNALCGEAGEVANMAKKLHMLSLHPEWISANEPGLPTGEDFKKKLADELGDALFYLTRVALDNDMNLADIMINQLEKIQKQSKHYGRTFLK